MLVAPSTRASLPAIACTKNARGERPRMPAGHGPTIVTHPGRSSHPRAGPGTRDRGRVSRRGGTRDLCGRSGSDCPQNDHNHPEAGGIRPRSAGRGCGNTGSGSGYRAVTGRFPGQVADTPLRPFWNCSHDKQRQTVPSMANRAIWLTRPALAADHHAGELVRFRPSTFRVTNISDRARSCTRRPTSASSDSSSSMR